MKDSINLPIPGLRWRRTQKTNTLEALLEVLPQAAILVYTKTDKIVYANRLASELSAFAQSELTGRSIQTIVDELGPDEQDHQDSQLTKSSFKTTPSTKILIRHNLPRITVQVSQTPLDDMEHLLLLIQSVDKEQLPDFQNPIPLLTSYHSLFDALQETDLQTALNQILETGHLLTGAETLAIFQAHEQEPHLQLIAYYGNTQSIPDELPAQDLVFLNTPHHWKPGKRPISALHRAGQRYNYSNITSAPLGHTNAIIGLVMIGNTQAPQPLNIISDIQILASTVTAILQRHSFISAVSADQKNQQRLLRENTTLEDSMIEGLLVIAPNTKILRMNQSAEMALGYTSQEVIGQNVDKVLIGTAAILPALSTALQGSAIYNLGNVHLFRRNGEAFPAQVRIFPVLDQEQANEIIILITDLSEQEQYRTIAQELEQRAVLGDLSAVFAHEVRNPINNISTGLQLMAYHSSEGDPNQDNIARMLQDCDRLDELFKTVLAHSRPKNQEMRELDIAALLHRLLDRLRPRIKRMNVKSDLQITADLPPIQGDYHALERVFINLINNALQAMSSTGGRLVIKAQPRISPEDLNYIEISIADTGPGIPEEQLEHIFKPFFTTKRDGTGIGLAITKRIITAHKGYIKPSSFPGGTVFSIQLPISIVHNQNNGSLGISGVLPKTKAKPEEPK